MSKKKKSSKNKSKTVNQKPNLAIENQAEVVNESKNDDLNVEKTENVVETKLGNNAVKDNANANAKKSKIESKDKDKKKSTKSKEPKEKGKLKRKAKETISEIKKVTWPTFGEVVRKTGVVLAVVIIFAVVIFGIDTLLGYLTGLIR